MICWTTTCGAYTHCLSGPGNSCYWRPPTPPATPPSCGVPGTAPGLVRALERFGSAPLAELVGPAVRLAREGAAVNAEQAYILEILAPIHDRLGGTR